MPDIVTIYNGAWGLSYLPPDGTLFYVRDCSWSFYRGGVRWVCLAKSYDDPGPGRGRTYAPAMLRSLDNGATWSGPIDDAHAPAYWHVPGADIDGGSALVWNYDIRADGTADRITVLIQTGVVTTGEAAGEFAFAYCDFDLDAGIWGSTYGDFVRDANVDYSRGYSSQPDSGTPIFWSTNPDRTFQVEGAGGAVYGAIGYGIANLAVADDGTVFAVGDTRDAGMPDPTTAPDAGYSHTSNLRIVGMERMIASGRTALTMYSQLITSPHTDLWESTELPDFSPQTYGMNPWVIYSEGDMQVYWCGIDGSNVYRSVNHFGTWPTPELVCTVDGITLGPNVCNNPVLGGVDVTLVLGSYDLVTFHIPSTGGGGEPTFAARYYGM